MQLNEHGAVTKGRIFWYVPSRGLGRPRNVVVTKVGREWFYFEDVDGGNERRASLKTLEIDSGGMRSPGCLHESEERWQYNAMLNDAWSDFVKSLPHSTPHGIDLNSIGRAREALGLPPLTK